MTKTDNAAADNSGLRYDEGKPPMHLLPWDTLLELAHIYGRGAIKYAPRNWEKGMNWSRVFDSLTRHAAAWNNGQDIDRESFQLHMLHVAWNALALATYQLRGIGVDDRPTVFDQAVAEMVAEENRRAAGCTVLADGPTDDGKFWMNHFDDVQQQTTGPILPTGTAIEIKEGVKFRTEAGSSLVWEIIKSEGGGFFRAALAFDGTCNFNGPHRPMQMMTLRSIDSIVETPTDTGKYRCLHCPSGARSGHLTCEDCDTGRSL
jgi:hypothetical protein